VPVACPLSHGFPLGLLGGGDACLMKPNARGEPRLEAEAERRLEGVGSSASFGWGVPWTVRGDALALDPVPMVGPCRILLYSPPSPSTRLYLITSSAWKSTVGGIVSPMAVAVFRLMTNSNCMGCSTGKSAGLAPFKSLSTWEAARRNRSRRLIP